MVGGTFPGYPSGGTATAVPAAFFSHVMPLVSGPAELAVLTYAFHAIHRVQRVPRHVSGRELLAEEPLRQTLARLGLDPERAVLEGLAAGVEHGALTCVEVVREGVADRLYFLNSASGRRQAARVRAGLIPVPGTVRRPPPGDAPARPSIFGLYEDTIGTLTPAIAAELEAAEQEYEPAWIEHAFREAATHGARNWRYVRAILDRLASQGGRDETDRRGAAEVVDKRYVTGRYGRYLDGRGDGGGR